VSAAIIGFFLPWAQLHIRETQLEKEIASGARKGLSKSFGVKSARRQPSWLKSKSKNMPLIPTKIAGVQIPRMANRENVKVAMGLIKLFTKKDEAVGLKTYAVYLVPGLAVLCGILLTRFGTQQAILVLVAVLCAAVAGGGFWTLLTTDTKKQFAIAIRPGLWLSLWAYVGLAAVALQSVVGRFWRWTRRDVSVFAR
jgi:hypothetical protein